MFDLICLFIFAAGWMCFSRKVSLALFSDPLLVCNMAIYDFNSFFGCFGRVLEDMIFEGHTN